MAWWTPTLRAVRWSPLLGAIALATAALGVVRLLSGLLIEQAHVIVLAMIVIGGVSGLHDPGRGLVQAAPVSALRRLVHRLVMLVPVTTLGALTVRALGSHLFPRVAPGPGWAALTALAAVGVAACVMLTRRLGTVANDVVVYLLLAWVVGGMLLSQADAPLGAAMPWWRWPASVAAAAVGAAIVAVTRGVEA